MVYSTVNAQTLRYRAEFVYDANQISAMLILKYESEILKGSMINEFGVCYVEFIVKKGSAKVIRLHPILKRPFLKKVIKRDFELLARSLALASEEVLWSKKRGIYLASCRKQIDEERKILSLHIKHQNVPLSINLYPF